MPSNIVNQVGVTSYGEPAAWLEGQVMGECRGYPRAYPARCNAWTLTFSGDIGAGTVGATWTDELGFDIAVEVEITGNVDDGFEIDGNPVTDAADVAEAWAAALEAHADSGSRVKSATADAGVVTITGYTPGRAYTLGSETSLTPVAQVITVTVAGNDDGLYRLAITVGEDAPENADYTASGNTIEQIRDELELAAEALALDLVIGVVSTNQITVEAGTAGTPISITLTSPSADLTQETTAPNVSLALVATETVDPNGGPVAYGRALVLAEVDGQTGIRQVENGDTASQIAGFVGRFNSGTRQSEPTPDDEPTIDPGNVITPIEYARTIALRNAGDTDAAAGGLIYVVINDAGGDTLGTCRADADGGNAVTPTLFRARWLTAVAAGAVGLASLR